MIKTALCAVMSCAASSSSEASDSVTAVASVGASVGAHEGTLAVYVASFEDGHTERWGSLRVGPSREVRLVFDDPATLKSLSAGARIRVWGEEENERLHVTRYLELPAESETPFVAQSVTANATPNSQRQETYAFVLVDTGSGVNLTAAQAQTAFFSTTPSDLSFATFYAETSFGQYTVTGDVLGPFTYADTNCNSDGMANTIEPMIPKKYNHYVYYIGQKESSCGFTGVAGEGSAASPDTRTWLNGSSSCVVRVQEPGHNLGLQHSNTITCPGASFSATVQTSCTLKEYGDRLTPMGSGCHQFTGYEKWYEQWLTGCNGVRVTASGTFHLSPLETQCPGGVQVLQVPLPTPQTVMDPEGGPQSEVLHNYYVEFRAPVGLFDQTLAPTVPVYAADEIPTGNRTSLHTYILDMNPATSAFDGLSPGQTFTDPGGALTIKLESLTATDATVTVTVPNSTGPSTCIGGAPLPAGTLVCAGPDGGVPPAGSSGAGSSGGASTSSSGSAGMSSSSSSSSGSSTTSSSGAPVGGSSSSGGLVRPDAGGPSEGDASSAAGASGTATFPSEASGGCSCRVGASEAEGGLGALSGALAAMMGVMVRRRRRFES